MRGAERGARLQQQRRFADSRIAAQQRNAAGNEAAAKHAIEFIETGRNAAPFLCVDGCERCHDRARSRDVLEARTGADGDRLDQRIPCVAVRTLSLPFRAVAAAFAALINGSRPRHRATLKKARTDTPLRCRACPRQSRRLRWRRASRLRSARPRQATCRALR